MTTIEKKTFGRTEDGTPVHMYKMQNSQGAFVEILDYGCIIQRIMVPDKNGFMADVCWGYDTLEEYESTNSHFGALIGRHANRIAKGEFELNGKTYQLAQNDGPNHLHGGIKGFDKYVWDARMEGERLVLSRQFPDMDEGYPGNLDVTVTYQFTDKNELFLEYHAVSDQDTVVNMTNHSYFNLGGHNSGSILGHILEIEADMVTENDQDCLPTGVIAKVEDTPFDFTKAKPIGRDIDEDNEQLQFANGYDINFVLRQSEGIRKAAAVKDPVSGRVMCVYTDKPGLQLYTSNWNHDIGKEGSKYSPRESYCLETQYFPNSLRCKNFPTAVLKAGDPYHFTTVYEFTTE